jgi:hypothetical protein
MQIAEMRSALNKQNQEKRREEIPDSFPDWAVRHIYERRNGLELTPVPAEVIREAEQRSAKWRAERAKAVIADCTKVRTIDAKLEEADRELSLTRIRVALARLQ